MNNKFSKTIYFVRHGQSKDNIAPVFQSTDSPLSEIGKQQAEYIAKRVAKLNFEALISSPYLRAKQTAEFIERITGKNPEYSDLFMERKKPTSIMGKPYSDEIASQTWKKWEESIYNSGIRCEDGENFDDLISRADQALKYLLERKEENLLVVTHGFLLKTITARVLLDDLLTDVVYKKFQAGTSMENTGLTVIRYETSSKFPSRWRLWIYNDHAHLG